MPLPLTAPDLRGSDLMLSVPRRAVLAVAPLLVLTLAACSGASITPLPSGAEAPSDCARVADGVIPFSAKDLRFSAPCMIAYVGEAFTIHFTNEDSQPHNVAVYQDASKSSSVMQGAIVATQGKSADYEVDAMNLGTHFFDCTVHAEMKGNLYVVPKP
jgi:plastocyanin